MRIQSLFILMFYGISIVAQSLPKSPIIARSGKWSVRQSIDGITDETSCTGLYKNRFDIQVNFGKFYLNMQGKGGIEYITMRFDDDPPISRLPTEMEKKLSIIDINGEVFDTLSSAHRLRIQILTVLNTMKEEDIDLNGFSTIYPIIINCKVVEKHASKGKK